MLELTIPIAAVALVEAMAIYWLIQMLLSQARLSARLARRAAHAEGQARQYARQEALAAEFREQIADLQINQQAAAAPASAYSEIYYRWDCYCVDILHNGIAVGTVCLGSDIDVAERWVAEHSLKDTR